MHDKSDESGIYLPFSRVFIAFLPLFGISVSFALKSERKPDAFPICVRFESLAHNKPDGSGIYLLLSWIFITFLPFRGIIVSFALKSERKPDAFPICVRIESLAHDKPDESGIYLLLSWIFITLLPFCGIIVSFALKSERKPDASWHPK